MKLSDIVLYLNHLEQDNMRPEFSAILSQVHAIFHDTTSRHLEIDNFNSELTANLTSIEKSVSEFETTMSLLKDRLKQIVKQYEPEYYAASLRLWEDDMSWETNEYILNRSVSITFEEKEAILNRIRIFADWRTPGMILRPGKEDFIESMVPLDPLYLVDRSEEMLFPSTFEFPEQYRRRLRPYIVDEYDSTLILGKLPDEQFAMCLAYNFFNFKPFEVIKCYLTEIYQKLKNGGTLAITFNDCDRAAGVELAERSFMCYTPGGMVVNLARSIGYEVKQTFHADAANCWVELRKPGTLTSIKGGQSLAEIIAKSK